MKKESFYRKIDAFQSSQDTNIESCSLLDFWISYNKIYIYNNKIFDGLRNWFKWTIGGILTAAANTIMAKAENWKYSDVPVAKTECNSCH